VGEGGGRVRRAHRGGVPPLSELKRDPHRQDSEGGSANKKRLSFSDTRGKRGCGNLVDRNSKGSCSTRQLGEVGFGKSAGPFNVRSVEPAPNDPASKVKEWDGGGRDHKKTAWGRIP